MAAQPNSLLLSWPGLAVQAFAAIVALFVWRRYFSQLSDIPGPWLASFSRFWHVRHIWIGDQNTQLVRLHEKHGYFVRIANNEVSVSHPDGIKKILLTQLPKGQWYRILQLPDWRYESAMATVDPKKKIERSKSFTPAYSLTNVLQQEDVVDEAIEMLLRWLDKYAEGHNAMDLDKFFTFTAFDIVGELNFSRKFGFLETGADLGNSISNSLALNALAAVIGFFTPWNRIFMNPLMTELGVLPMGHLFDTTMAALSIREKNPDARNDIVGRWLHIHASQPDRLSLREIHSQATATVGAGADTVSCGLQSFIYHVMRHPTAWDRARDEIDAAVAQGLCQDGVVSFAEAQKLPYFQACIKESLRMFPPVPMGLPRVATKGGVTIGGRTFAEGTILSVSPSVVHFSKELWGPDVRDFNPDRWLRSDATTLEKYWIPFGAGYNSCPGHHIAKMEISKICATLLRDYCIHQVDATQNWTYSAYFTVVPHSWPCYIEKRVREVPSKAKLI
ncbi:cytochrome P450 [Thozetella sp. PMI_491]|nr:cytochrome P450 [Thozetella sp. PMI_491]